MSLLRKTKFLPELGIPVQDPVRYPLSYRFTVVTAF